ncbi:Na/Pi cotransporter family protein [Leptotrichia buccalis]|uniref:Na/Pi-cotransporter II-related protein n=1 Tax=Leptotrichia buccalis (strain ATCC 14201 / DSM 1135 / JCM 12969 / NCTC 10249 / C-1013-b) TaxID=523794 RepID=C7N9Q6_LEPBD|nr:Na/Pi cotransporter family protein [Leptotrichia buccalis]ACV38887.1 Na/Pi-cotransporter II-related protein [Leptotrichia buccalis C-1013-b]
MNEVALNTINYQQMAFGFLGGLGLFLFCIKYMGDGLQMAAGDRLRFILDKYTTSPFLGVLVGIFVTALIQSSSGTSVITIGLVGAGLLTLRQAIGIIMGANIGTTITTFIIGFNITHYALPILFLGAACLFFVRHNFINNLGRILFGFGGIFFALTLMSGAMEPLKYLPAFTDLTVKLSHQPILGVFIGTIITMLVQASSATISILQNVYQENLITLKAALPVLFGDNIGTTITAIIAVIGANTSAKRLALSHTMFNIIGTAIFLVLLSPFSIFVEKMAQILHLNPKVTIAFAHGSFNVMTTILLFPFIGLLEYIVVKVIKEKDEDKVEHKPKYLDSALISAPSIALGQVKQEMLSMISITLKSLERSVKFFHDHDEKDAERVEKSEDAINNIDQEITKYLTTLSQEHITEKDGEEISMYLDMCRDVERIGDHAIGIIRDVRYEIKKKVVFTDVAHQEIEKLFRISKRIIETAEEALKNDDTEKAFAVVDLHNKLYAKEKEVRKAHIKRVSKQQCDVKAGLYYIDVVSHFTRIGDHARNLVEKMIENRAN